MASRFVDRLQTAAITATLTSAAWIVFGSIYLGGVGRPATDGIADSPGSVAEQQRRPVPAGASEGAEVVPPASAAGLVVPVVGVAPNQLADTFGDARGGGTRLHEALDIMAPAGTPVIAAGPGTIERLFVSDDGGNTVYVRSADRLTIHYYAHLREYVPGLAEGQAVRRGQRLGTVGTSGNADPAAPHLHFAVMRTTVDAEWWEPATALNPFSLLTGT